MRAPSSSDMLLDFRRRRCYRRLCKSEVPSTHYHAPQRHPQPPPSLRRHPRPATSPSRRHPSHAHLRAASAAQPPPLGASCLKKTASATKRGGAGPEAAARGAPCHAPPQMVARPTCAGVLLCALPFGDRSRVGKDGGDVRLVRRRRLADLSMDGNGMDLYQNSSFLDACCS
ncbi:hypothetical protein BJ912DRAFT_1149274, partial [Pholiota molesta]